MLRGGLLLLALIGGSVDASIEEIALSGRCVEVADNPDARVATKPQFAPGPASCLKLPVL